MRGTMSGAGVAMRNGEVSWWWRDLGGAPAPRPALTADIDVDVAIVGAGYTGLWTAYHLKTLQPDLRVAILEARFAGFGASGRNGGWLTNTVTGGREGYARSHGRDAAVAQQAAMNRAVAAVQEVAVREGIEADIAPGGEFLVARNAAQWSRLRAMAQAESSWPGTDWSVLGREAARERIAVSGALGALWHPHAARIHPAKLVVGLAQAVERLGVAIHEQTEVTRIEPGKAVTSRGTVRASFVIRATEGFTARMPGQRRTWLPMNSSQIVTEPLSASTWEEMGWRDGAVLGDFAHAYMYAQRTADDRLVFGGRGVPYRFGSRLDHEGQTQDSAVASLARLAAEFFPQTRRVAVEHAWAGVLGVPRDWRAGVAFDAASGLAWAGGYVGTGVAATHLAGETLADLVLGRDTDLVRLPWVNPAGRRWEVEPLRWLGVHGLYAAYRAADRAESRGRTTTSPLARIADRIAGR